MRSASRKPRGGLLVASGLLLTGALVGCTTTQQKAAWLSIRSERTLLAREPTRVKRANGAIEVTRAAILRGPSGAAIAVGLRNTGRRPLNDLPLAVGVRTAGGGAVQLNRKPGPYFQSHAPALPPRAATTWVYLAGKEIDSGTAFARVGRPASPPPTVAGEVPELTVTKRATVKGRKGTTVRAEVENTTGIAQYDLEVYAWALRKGRYLAAGRARIAELNPGEDKTVSLRLIGDPRGAPVHVSAPPTIFE